MITLTHRRDVEVREALAAARLREALLQIGQITESKLSGFDHHREHAVGDLARAAHAGRADRRRVDRHVSRPCRMLFSGLPRPVVPGPVAGMS